MSLEEKLKQLNFTKEDYEFIKKDYSLSRMVDDTLLEKIEQTEKYFSNTFNFDICEIKKMGEIFPTLYSYSKDNIETKKGDLLKIGYSDENIKKLVRKHPQIYSYSIENINQKISDLIDLGFKNEEVLNITITFPSIFGVKIETIKEKISEIERYGYQKEEVFKIILSFPYILGFSKENIKEKLEFYIGVDMKGLPVLDARQLMQSIKLTNARYNFYTSRGEDININSYSKLYMNEKQFVKQYGITKEELIEEYNYLKTK